MPDPFLSADDLSSYLGRDVTADEGAVIALDSACEIVRTVAEQSFDLVISDTIVLDGTGTDCLLLPELPVSAAGTVVLNGGTLVAGRDYMLASDGRLIRTAGTAYTTNWWTWSGPVWMQGRQNVTVTYDHGHGTVPSDVRMVALALADRIVVQGAAVFEALPNGQQVRYAGPALDLTANELRILRKYRIAR